MSEIDFRHDLLPLKNKLFRVALRITLDRPEAEDVVEDVLVKTWEKRNSPELQRVQNLEAYCLTLTREGHRDRFHGPHTVHLTGDNAPNANPSTITNFIQ